MSLCLTHKGFPQDFTRSDLLTLLEQQGKAAGLSLTDIKVLKHYILKVRTDDFKTGRICAVWQKLPAVAHELDLNERSVTRAENKLIAAGWLLKTNAPKSRRDGNRDKGSNQRIVWAAGINLQPLIDTKVSELQQLAQARHEAKLELTKLRTETKRLFAEIRSLRISEALERALSILPFGRLSRIRSVEQLHKVITSFSSLLSFFQKQVVEKPVEDMQLEQTKPPSQTDKMSARSNTIQKTLSPKSRRSTVRISFRQCVESAHPDMLENMRILGGYSQANFIEAANLFRRELHISDELWKRASHRLSRLTTATLVSIIYRNHQLPSNHKAHVRNGSACLETLICKAFSDPQLLTRLLFKNLETGKA